MRSEVLTVLSHVGGGRGADRARLRRPFTLYLLRSLSSIFSGPTKNTGYQERYVQNCKPCDLYFEVEYVICGEWRDQVAFVSLGGP